MTTRIELINYFIKKYNYKTYLEIGVQQGISFKGVDLPVENKVGVDPDLNSRATVYMTSDGFFAQNDKKFDIIFVDGLHECEAVYRDIINSLDILNEGGVVICHDMNPLSKEAQQVPRIQKLWNGDCWLAWMRLRLNNPELSMAVVDIDHGCGVIKKGSQETLTIDKFLTYENLEKNRKEWLNLISVEEFKQQY